MYLDAAKKQEIFSKYGKSNTDTGSVESQVALFSYRIARLTEHMKLSFDHVGCQTPFVAELFEGPRHRALSCPLERARLA